MNRCDFLGRLTRDVELRYTSNGKAVCDISLALNEGKDREATFVDCVAWEKTAEIAAQYLKKGRPVLVSCRYSLDKWESEDGENRSKPKFIINQLELLPTNPKDDESADETPKVSNKKTDKKVSVKGKKQSEPDPEDEDDDPVPF